MARRQLPGYGEPPAGAREWHGVLPGCGGCRDRTAGVGRLRRPAQAHPVGPPTTDGAAGTFGVQPRHRRSPRLCLGAPRLRLGVQLLGVGALREWVGASLLRLDAQPLRIGGTATEADGAAPVARSPRTASPGAAAEPRSAGGVTPNSGECAAPHPVPLPQGERAPPPGPLFARRLASRENSFSLYLIPFSNVPAISSARSTPACARLR